MQMSILSPIHWLTLSLLLCVVKPNVSGDIDASSSSRSLASPEELCVSKCSPETNCDLQNTPTTYLDCSGLGLTDIPKNLGQLCPCVKVLLMSGNALTSVCGLQTLQNLTNLVLSNNRITDFTCLVSGQLRRRLNYLDISYNLCSSLDFLQEDKTGLPLLSGLFMLSISHNPIRLGPSGAPKLAPLSKYQLRTLYASGLGLTTISSINTLLLENVDFSWNDLTDVSQLESSLHLMSLNLNYNPGITALPANLKYCNLLTVLLVTGTGISDLSPLSGLRNLITVDVSATKVVSLEDLRESRDMRTLRASGLKVLGPSDLGYVGNMTKLQTFYCSACATKITTFDMLKFLHVLEVLDLSHHPHVDNVEFLVPLPAIRRVTLDHMGLRTFSPELIAHLSRPGVIFDTSHCPSECGYGVSLTDAKREVLCHCADGFYGTTSCQPVSSELLQPPEFMTLYGSCFNHPALEYPICPNTTEFFSLSSNIPVYASLYVFIELRQTGVFKSANLDTQIAISIFNINPYTLQREPPVEVVYNGGLRENLVRKDIYIDSNSYLPVIITMSVSRDSPTSLESLGLRLVSTAGSTQGLVDGCYIEGTPTKAGVFRVVLDAADAVSGETGVGAFVILNIKPCVDGSCGSHGACISDECVCDKDYDGEFCDQQIPKHTFDHKELAIEVGTTGAILVVIFAAAAWYYRKQLKYTLLVWLQSLNSSETAPLTPAQQTDPEYHEAQPQHAVAHDSIRLDMTGKDGTDGTDGTDDETAPLLSGSSC